MVDMIKQEKHCNYHTCLPNRLGMLPPIAEAPSEPNMYHRINHKVKHLIPYAEFETTVESHVISYLK